MANSKVRYQISTWSSSTAREACEYRTFKRIDAALDETWAQIYAMCKADAALDTARAHRLLKEFRAFCAECDAIHPLKNLHYVSRNFELSSDQAGRLDHVKFVAIRDDR